jgi:DNA repair protein RecO (recombination protein O)
MHHKTEGIVLHSLKYGDNSLIVKIFTREHGLRTFMIRGLRAKKSTVKASLFMPLTIITMDIQNGRMASSFNTIRDAHCHRPLHSLQSDFTKQAIALFLAEVLYKTIADDAPHEDLYDYIDGVLKYLDAIPSIPSVFPQHFLVSYSRFLGLYPNDHGENSSRFFDMRDGIFHPENTVHADYMREEESVALKVLLETGISNIHEIKMGNNLRNKLLLALLHYYKIHLLNFREIKSHTVLSEVLRG